MDFVSTELPYEIFKLIRSYVGERYPYIKKSLVSHVYESADRLFRNIYGIPSMDPEGVISWTVFPINPMRNKPYHNKIVALGCFEYVRTVPVVDEQGNFLRQVFVFRSPRKIWTFPEFVEYIMLCETELREDHNPHLGHMFCEGIDVEHINNYDRVYPYIH